MRASWDSYGDEETLIVDDSFILDATLSVPLDVDVTQIDPGPPR